MTIRDGEAFGLEDWPSGGVSRRHALHVAYLRAARRAGAPIGEYVSLPDVAARDGWSCCACGQPVPQRWTAAELGLAPVLAFTVPLAEGARYVSANVQLAHLDCARFADVALGKAVRRALADAPSTKTRASGKDETCINGHELAGANLLRAADGRRRCRQCRNDRERATA